MSKKWRPSIIRMFRFISKPMTLPINTLWPGAQKCSSGATWIQSPGQGQAITWTNDSILTLWSLNTFQFNNSNDKKDTSERILHTFGFLKMYEIIYFEVKFRMGCHVASRWWWGHYCLKQTGMLMADSQSCQWQIAYIIHGDGLHSIACH